MLTQPIDARDTSPAVHCLFAFVWTVGISGKLKSYTSVQKFLKDVKRILQNCREYNEEVEGEQGQAEFIELSNLMEKQADELCAQVCAAGRGLVRFLSSTHCCTCELDHRDRIVLCGRS